MADRYQDRPFPADDDYNRRGDSRAPAKAEGDPLAELARLIGQTDPFATMGRANQQVQPRGLEREQYQQPPVAQFQPPVAAPPEAAAPAAGPPGWMQRASREIPPRQEVPAQDYPGQDYPTQDYPAAQDHPNAVHPVHRYATPRATPEPKFQEPPAFAEAEQESDPSRYDEALYGQLAPQEQQYDQAFADDSYAYQDDYGDEGEDPVRKRGGGMMMVAIVLALAVVGTGGAFAYRTYVGSPRSGEPPIIRADSGPTKMVPNPADSMLKLPDRMAAGDGTERIVPREEAPVDINGRSNPRVVFPSLNQNSNPPPPASVAQTTLPPSSGASSTLVNPEPRKIRTMSIRGDQPDTAATPVGSVPAPAKPAPPTRAMTNANASSNAPMSITPQAAEPKTRSAAIKPEPAAAAMDGTGGYLVQVASQKNEADAQASFRSLQTKYAAALGSRTPLIKRADLGEKGVYYRAMVGPFGSRDEATQFCGGLKTAGGQCVVVQSN
jgi:SPOR domain